MADNLTDTSENLLLDWLNPALSAPTRPTSPLKLALMTANGSDSAAGTEVAGGSYARQNITLAAASGGSASNSGAITFSGMPACTVVGVEIYDSAGSPVRLWYGSLDANRVVGSGDAVTFAAGAVTVSLG